jgi:pantoate--beta-alanine ligase
VLTVVLKLINSAEPDLAFFGQKDIQQALLIRRLARDLDLPVTVRVVPTLRDADGLALSSRNAYLTAAQRHLAPLLAGALAAAARRLAAGETDPEAVRQAGLELLAGHPELVLDYLQVVELESLQVPRRIAGPVVVAGAVRLGATRLIDNIIHPAAALARLASGEQSS